MMVELKSAVDQVVEWESEWIHDEGDASLWGDRIVWQSAREIAQRLDARTPKPRSPMSRYCIDPSPEGLEAYRNRRPASASGTVSDEAMDAFTEALEAWARGGMSSQAAARVIQQYGDQCRAEGDAAGFRRGVEAAAKVAQGARDAWAASLAMHHGDVMEVSRQAADTILANTLALLKTQEAG